MQQVVIIRGESTKYGTFGKLLTEGFSCDTLELPWKANKVGLSCIPVGEYRLEMITAGRFFGGRRDLYEVKGVSGRTEILIHAGNWAGDTELGLKSNTLGCILLGDVLPNDNTMIFHSQTKTDKFIEHMAGQPAVLHIIRSLL